ncbi:MAG: hypothetical protein GX051_09245 [Clostridiales bacterium]|nr:hypothetical protein [Clostridiales bacterium]
MNIFTKAKDLLHEIKAYWRSPAKGDYVAYKEILMLSLGWLGMRFATVFGISFGVGNAFTGMTLHMTNRDLLIMGYVCTAIGYMLAPLNAYIIDNLRSRSGKYRVYIKLAVPAGILSMFALFFPYEKLGYIPMVVSLFVIGQIQGYVQNWYSTGVSNLVYVMSPNSKERVRIMMISSLVHNFAPSLTGLFIPVLSDVFADGDLYNINTYRIIYPAFIVVGVAMSLTAYYGVKERIVQPQTRVTGVGLGEALRAVSRNKLFWIKCTDEWNNFLEGAKNCLMEWVFYYGKVGSMTMYGIINTVSYNSSMWAMLVSPYLIDRLGKKNFKVIKNILQVFIILGLAATYRKSVIFIGIFYFLDRFCETTEVIDRAIESDVRDYQQYISGERIDGAFGVIQTYVGGGIGALTNLFIPWVYKRNGFDGTDYSVLEVYDENGVYKPNNVLYPLINILLTVSVVGAAADILPWLFYDLTETKQKSVIRVIRVRSAIEDKAAGLVEDELYCEACEALTEAFEYIEKQPAHVPKAKSKEEKLLRRQLSAENEKIEIAEFVLGEINRYKSDFGKALLQLSEATVAGGLNNYYKNYEEIIALAYTLPRGENKLEKDSRRDAVSNARAIHRSGKLIEKYYPDGLEAYDAAAYEEVFRLPEDTKEQRREKHRTIKLANKARKTYGKAAKPYLTAMRNITLSAGYNNIGQFMSEFGEARTRLDEAHALRKAQSDAQQAERAAEAQRRLEQKKAEKALKGKK